MSDLPKRLRITASMIALGERIAWGSDTALMEEAADVIEALIASVENHQLHMLGIARDRDQLRAMLSEQQQASLCSDCGYLTSQREHLGCLRKAVAELDAATGGQPQASAAQSAPAGEREAEAAAIAEEIDWLIRQWDAKASWSGERMAELLEAAGKASEMLAAWQRTQSAGVPDVPAMARVLSDRSADACNIDRTDNWAMYGQEYIEDVQAMLAAAAPAQPAAQGEFGDAYQGAREDLAIWKRRALEAEEKLRKAEQSTPEAIEVIGYASPGQVEIVRSLPRTGGMKVKGCKDGRYTEPVVLLSVARAALFATVIRCEQAGAFKACMECGYQDGHDEICKFHYINRAAQEQGEVQRLREALEEIRHANMNGPVSESNAGCIKRIEQIAERALAASTAQQGEGEKS